MSQIPETGLGQSLRTLMEAPTLIGMSQIPETGLGRYTNVFGREIAISTIGMSQIPETGLGRCSYGAIGAGLRLYRNEPDTGNGIGTESKLETWSGSILTKLDEDGNFRVSE